MNDLDYLIKEAKLEALREIQEKVDDIWRELRHWDVAESIGAGQALEVIEQAIKKLEEQA